MSQTVCMIIRGLCVFLGVIILSALLAMSAIFIIAPENKSCSQRSIRQENSEVLNEVFDSSCSFPSGTGCLAPWPATCSFYHRHPPEMHSTHWAIFGERDSGTNLLTKLVKANFNASQDKRIFKHLYFLREGGVVDWVKANTHVAIIMIVRSPMDWLMAMYDNHHEASHMVRRKTFTQFLLSSPWESRCCTRPATRIVNDSYLNVFDLRKSKLSIFISIFGLTDTRSIIFNFETLSANQLDSLCILRETLGLRPLLSSPMPINFEARSWVKPGKISTTRLHALGMSNDSVRARYVICQRIDWTLEGHFGYSPPVDCNFTGHTAKTGHVSSL